MALGNIEDTDFTTSKPAQVLWNEHTDVNRLH